MFPIRVLHILDGLKSGGAETFIMNVYRNINRDEVQFDFLIRNRNGNVHIEEVKRLGGKVFFLPSFPKHFLKNRRELKDFFKKHDEYSIVHVHANSSVYILPLIYAKDSKIPCRILHSHNTKAYNRIATTLHFILRNYASKIATEHFACSTEAGKWMFYDKSFQILNNSVDAEKFRYDNNIRKQVRAEMQLEDKIVIGHIGRFVSQKNHIFLLKLFRNFLNKNRNAILLLVGDGPLKKNIEAEVERMSLTEHVKFLGVRNDIPRLLQCMDAFLFPSLFEGLPFTLIEAQASGLPCVISDSIVDDVIITKDIVKKVSLNSDEEVWCSKINEVLKLKQRKDTFNEIYQSGFHIKNTSELLETFYKSH